LLGSPDLLKVLPCPNSPPSRLRPAARHARALPPAPPGSSACNVPVRRVTYLTGRVPCRGRPIPWRSCHVRTRHGFDTPRALDSLPRRHSRGLGGSPATLRRLKPESCTVLCPGRGTGRTRVPTHTGRKRATAAPRSTPERPRQPGPAEWQALRVERPHENQRSSLTGPAGRLIHNGVLREFQLTPRERTPWAGRSWRERRFLVSSFSCDAGNAVKRGAMWCNVVQCGLV
jgi:hypothetical protein